MDTDNNPKCFQVDYNNNQIEFSYNDGEETSLFPVIIDEDVDEDGNLIANNSDNDQEDFDEVDDRLNFDRYLKRNNFNTSRSNSSSKSNSLAKGNSLGKIDENKIDEVKRKNDNDEEDEMFKALRRISTAYDAFNSNNKARFSVSSGRKMSTVPFQPFVTKQLTFIINEIYFTNGKTSLELVQRTNKLQTNFFVRKKLFNKSVRCVGTSLKNCVQSDVISIDIDEKSTFLPIMCKYMIIVEGAVLERGEPIMVRDFSIQVNINSTGKEVHYDETHERYVQSYTEENSDNENNDNEQIKETKYDKVSRGNNNKRNKFRKVKKQLSISGRRDSYYRRQSYFNTNEYSSIPYYQYLNSNRTTKEAETITEDYYLMHDNNIMIINSNHGNHEYESEFINIPIELTRNDLQIEGENDEEIIEVAIPIKVENNNRRFLKVNQGVYRYKPICARRKTVYEETYNKFEAEVTSYTSKYFKRYTGQNPVVYTFYHNGNDPDNKNKPYVEIENERSITQVFLGHLVDGSLKNS